MGSFRLSLSRGAALIAFPAGLVIVSASVSIAFEQQPVTGFAVEPFHPSAPGGGRFIIDDLNISSGFGATAELISSYARKPLEVTSGSGTQLPVVSDEALVE
jgi:hypothetical protein